ncbi:hypothetical protein ACTXT7_014685 [Hymenolepis weldensis]
MAILFIKRDLLDPFHLLQNAAISPLREKNQCLGPQRRHNRWTHTPPIISALDRIFMTHGFPETLVSENGTRFCLSHFEEYCRQRTIYHILTPRITQNQLASRAVCRHVEKGPTERQLLIRCWVNGRIINHEMIPKNKINEPAKSHKRDVFTVGDLMLASDFSIGYSWTGDVTAVDVTNNVS